MSLSCIAYSLVGLAETHRMQARCPSSLGNADRAMERALEPLKRRNGPDILLGRADVEARGRRFIRGEGTVPTLYARTLRRAADLAGGEAGLARRLGVSDKEVH